MLVELVRGDPIKDRGTLRRRLRSNRCRLRSSLKTVVQWQCPNDFVRKRASLLKWCYEPKQSQIWCQTRNNKIAAGRALPLTIQGTHVESGLSKASLRLVIPQGISTTQHASTLSIITRASFTN